MVTITRPARPEAASFCWDLGLSLAGCSCLRLCVPGAGGLTQLPVVLNEVHLGEEVDVRQLHVQHGGQGGTQYRNELGWVCAVVRIHEVHSGQLEGEETGTSEPESPPSGRGLEDGVSCPFQSPPLSVLF